MNTNKITVGGTLKEDDSICVKVITVNTRETNKSFVCEYNGIQIQLPFLSWQYSSKFHYPKELKIFNSSRKAGQEKFLQIPEGENIHPYFKLNEGYEFSFDGFKKTDNGTFLILRDVEGIGYTAPKQFNDDYHELKKGRVRFIFAGYKKNGEIKLYRKKALKLKDVFADSSPLQDNELKSQLEANEKYADYGRQYNNEDNKWLLTITNILEYGTFNAIEHKNYSFALKAIVYLEIAYDYLLNSGFLKTFNSNKANEIQQRAMYRSQKIRSLTAPLIALNTLNYDAYLIKSITLFIEAKHSYDELAANNYLRNVYDTIRIGSLDILSGEAIFNLYRSLFPYIDTSNFYFDTLLKVLRYKVRALDNKLFFKTFFDRNERIRHFKGNTDLIPFFNLSNLLAHISQTIAPGETIIWYAKCIRALSVFNPNFHQSKKMLEELIQQLGPVKKEYQLLPLKYYRTLEGHILKLSDSEEVKNVKWELLKQKYESNESIKMKIAGKDDLGFYILFEDYKGYIAKEFMKEYEAAYYFFYPEHDLPEFKIIAIDHSLKSFLVQYCRKSQLLNSSQTTNVGDVVRGIVIAIKRSGANVLVGSTLGFVHKSQIDYSPVSYVEDFLTIGKVYEFTIQKVNKSLELALNKKIVDPWWNGIRRYVGHVTNAVYLRKIDISYLKEYHGIEIEENDESGIAIADCAVCKNKYGIMGTLVINTIVNEWHCTNCRFHGQEMYLFKSRNLGFNISVGTKEMNKEDLQFASALQRGNIVPVRLTYFDYASRFADGTFDANIIKGQELLQEDSIVSSSEANVLELGRAFEDISSLAVDMHEEVAYLYWAKQFYSLANSSKSFWYRVYNLYLELIIALKSKNRSQVRQLTEMIKYVLGNEEMLKETSNVYKDLNNHLLVFKYFLLLDCGQYQENMLLLNERFNNAINNDTVRNFASIVLSHNLILSHAPNDIDKLYDQTFGYMYETLTKGKLNDIYGENLNEYQEDDAEKRNRIELLKLIAEGEGRRIEFKSTLMTPVLSEELKARSAEIEEQMKIARETNDKSLLNEARGKKDKLPTERDIQHSAMKSIAAFANSDGGYLIIGVDDQKNILGLEEDFKKLKKEDKQDEFKLRFDDLVKRYLGDSSHRLIDTSFVQVGEKTIFKVTVSKNLNMTNPIIMRLNAKGDSEAECYIRAQGSSLKLGMVELIEYIAGSYAGVE
ncbi:RNA-binding domain-containing protein [Chitinophaga ginsengisoli]|uniref:S1 RNA binding family protein n=1 Tax=Chitinophaga ginsengisoli TaxID=363837 RepID=A0A2P8GCL0_9BACT|nr:RNA-binding domain-containing protein [Chitinophaga ginsengisoli]PSL31709.1 S1 RNA binding family protein [Chitinophaga ginsengisoli]